MIVYIYIYILHISPSGNVLSFSMVCILTRRVGGGGAGRATVISFLAKSGCGDVRTDGIG